MKQIQASIAKAKLAELLDEVERGETIEITRHGKPIAALVPRTVHQHREIAEARAAILEIRKRTKPVTREEILAWRDEGRK